MKAVWTVLMPHQEQGLVDILEIYHARQLRDQLIDNLRRFRNDNPLEVQHPERRQGTRGYYEAMLMTTTALLCGLGDETPFG